MIAKFDTFDRLEVPTLTLCNPGSTYSNGRLSKSVGNISNHEALEVIINFNSPSELNFRVNDTPIMYVGPENSVQENNFASYTNGLAHEIFEKILSRRLIFVDGKFNSNPDTPDDPSTAKNTIGYFMITEIAEGYDGDKHYKDVKAQSIEIELQQWTIPFIPDGTYRFYDPRAMPNTNSESDGIIYDDILHMIVSTLPMWTIGHVDTEVETRYRTFNDLSTDINCLSFLIDNVQDAYNCIVLFDAQNRKIDVYDKDEFALQTGIHLTRGDVINSITITEGTNDIYTALQVIADNSISIGLVNPLGTSVIYNFDYYLPWMSTELRSALRSWKTRLAAAEANISGSWLPVYWYAEQGYMDNKAEVERLEGLIRLYESLKSNIIAYNTTEIVSQYSSDFDRYNEQAPDISEDIEEALAAIEEIISGYQSDLAQAQIDRDVASDTLERYNTERAEVAWNLSFANTDYFSPELYEELSCYMFQGVYNDEYMVVTESMDFEEREAQYLALYHRAKDQLFYCSAPSQEFSVDTESFIFSQKFKPWIDRLETGRYIDIEVDNERVIPLFLSSITYNHDDHNLQLTFGTRYSRFDSRTMFEKFLGQISKSSNSLQRIKDVLRPTVSDVSHMRQALQTVRNLTMSDALAAQNEEVTIDGAGYTGRRLLENGDGYDPHQVKMTSKNLVFTNDGWQTCGVAVGQIRTDDDDGDPPYGINAQYIVGDLIMGNELRIIADGDHDLMTVVEDKIATQIGDSVSGIYTRLEQAENAINIIASEGIETSTGYAFTSNGLRIRAANSTLLNKIDESGMYVSRMADGSDDSDDNVAETLLQANDDGVKAINLTAKQFLIIGSNCRFEDYTNKSGNNKRTACYSI